MNSTTAKTAVSSIVLALAALGSASSFGADSNVKNSAGEPLFPAFTSVLTRAHAGAACQQQARGRELGGQFRKGKA